MYEYKFTAPSERFVPDLEGSESHPDGVVKPGDKVKSAVKLNSPHFEKVQPKPEKPKKAEPKKVEVVEAPASEEVV